MTHSTTCILWTDYHLLDHLAVDINKEHLVYQQYQQKQQLQIHKITTTRTRHIQGTIMLLQRQKVGNLPHLAQLQHQIHIGDMQHQVQLKNLHRQVHIHILVQVEEIILIQVEAEAREDA
eukprot:NODE_658_length_4969_cov_1.543326.p5 type:complete len:120 gc:universal NODE_658_length_4969_cov_1.543326:1093-1452(+)